MVSAHVLTVNYNQKTRGNLIQFFKQFLINDQRNWSSYEIFSITFAYQTASSWYTAAETTWAMTMFCLRPKNHNWASYLKQRGGQKLLKIVTETYDKVSTVTLIAAMHKSSHTWIRYFCHPT